MSTDTDSKSIEDIAREGVGSFAPLIAQGRHSHKLVPSAAQWVSQAVRDAHPEEAPLPDDWVYEIVWEAFGAIAEAASYEQDLDEAGDEFADGVDVYTANLLAWSSTCRYALQWTEEAREEGLVEAEADLVERLRTGQYVARGYIYGVVRQAIEGQES